MTVEKGLRPVKQGIKLVAATVLGACIVFLASLYEWVPASFGHPFAVISLGMIIGLCGLIVARVTENTIGGASIESIVELSSADTVPQLISDADGKIIHRNNAAFEAGLTGSSITCALRSCVAEPDDSVQNLLWTAQKSGKSKDLIITLETRLVCRVVKLNAKRFSWSIEILYHDMVEDAQPLQHPLIEVDHRGRINYANKIAETRFGPQAHRLERLLPKLGDKPSCALTLDTQNGPQVVWMAQHIRADHSRQILACPMSEHHENHADMYFFNLPVAVLKISTQGEVLLANKAAQKMLGETLETAIHLSDLMEGLGRPMQGWLDEAASKRFQNQSEFLRLRRDDVEAFVQVTLGRVELGDETSVLAVLHDATELKTLEAQFVQSQKMQAIGQLAGGVAHDFNNLLTAITGHCDLLLLQHKEDAESADLIQIKENAGRAAALVGQLLAFSRKQTLQPVTLDVREALSGLTSLLDRLVAERISLELEPDPDVMCINVDLAQFEQVIVNIVVNARDAMPNGGTVRLDASNLTLIDPLKRDRATVPPGDYVSIRIIDQGTGISEEKRSKVFEPFYTTKGTGEGTGLGLSTAYGIVKQSGGFIFLDSTVGQGTEFMLLFPAIQHAECLKAKAVQVIEHKENDEGTVLLVEDEASVRAFASRALKFKGYKVIEAKCAEDALDLLKDPSLQIDLFVSDVVMPGMDGPTWVKEARKQRPDVNVIFMSGYAEESFAEEKAKIPNSEFMAKPFSLSELTTLVEQQISQLEQRLV